MLDLLYRSLDSTLENDEDKKLTKALEGQAWLQEELVQITAIRTALSELKIPANTNFTDNVIDELSPKKDFVFQSLWRLSVAATVITFVFAAGFIYYSSGNLDIETVIGLEEIEIENIYSLNN